MYRKGSFGDRFSAFIVDQILILIVGVILLVVANMLGANIGIDDYESIFGLLFILYSTLFVWRTGATIGKRLLKLKVVDQEYKPVGFWRALLRESLGKIISSLFNLGYLWVLIDKRKQSWHDKIARTLVVKLDQNGKMIPIQAEEEITGKKKVVFIILFLIIGLPLLLGGLFIIVYLFIAQPHKIAGQGMAPNYVDGQYYLTNKFTYKAGVPQRGDVIVFKAPTKPEVDYFKRIIGLPGEEIEIRDGKVYINNQELSETYLASGTYTNVGTFMTEGQKVKIPENQYFVLGDNRNHSSDSREWGFVPKENIVGRMDICYYKCSESAKK